jgi:hypothetical protein
MGWRDDWRDDCRAPTFTEYAAGKATMDDLIKYSAPPYNAPPRELSDAEWAEGYKRWRAAQKVRPCYAENEI